jgi:L-histidine N-alpha-methyltransferase
MALDLIGKPQNVHIDSSTELLAGLHAEKKHINPKFFYDELGSKLFHRICEQPEYYPTRVEIGIFQRHAAGIAEATGPDCQLLEPGAGACEKVRYLLPALNPGVYLPLDISAEFLLESVAQLRTDFPGLQVQPVVADFTADFELPAADAMGCKVVFYPGSTIGNFTPEQALNFLAGVAGQLGSGGGLLIGVDLHKSSAILNAAYNDAQGVTAAFNLNVLQHCNKLLAANFDTQQFEHLAFYNEQLRRIEMHLVSRQEQRVSGADFEIEFQSGERILTEYSYKYSQQDFIQLAAAAGLSQRQFWQDDDGLFGVFYFEVK